MSTTHKGRPPKILTVDTSAHVSLTSPCGRCRLPMVRTDTCCPRCRFEHEHPNEPIWGRVHA